MRILYFYQYFTTPAGAYSTRAYEFASRWVKAGDLVTVVTSVYDRSDIKPTGFLSTLNVDGIEVVVINVRLSNKHGFSHRLLTFAVYAVIACWYALFHPADVVISSSGPLTVAFPALVAHYLRRRPFVFEVRDLWPEGSIQLGILRNRFAIFMARLLARTCYRAAARVVCLSEGMEQWIRKSDNVTDAEVVPNASDNRPFSGNEDHGELPAWAVSKSLVVYAGALGLIDDCGQLLDMALVLQQRGVGDVEVVIVGDGKERGVLERRARELELDRVHFLGLMPKDGVIMWLRAARCALFVCKNIPFLATASPNKLFDAFAAGVPVVQTTQGWIKELLEREQCGITVPAEDPGALASAVLRVARDSELRAKLAKNASRVARELFDRDLLAARMRRILAEAAEKPRRMSGAGRPGLT
jgi:glycosyltransferase involved in cell wall biosynthesis